MTEQNSASPFIPAAKGFGTAANLVKSGRSATSSSYSKVKTVRLEPVRRRSEEVPQVETEEQAVNSQPATLTDSKGLFT